MSDIEFTGDADGAARLAAEAQAAIDSMCGKTVHVIVKLPRSGGGSET